MTLTVTLEKPPLQINSDGVIRINKTRVTLDTIVTIFKQGLTPEEIVYRYSSLQLADVYATISYYLNHQDEVEKYLEKRQKQAQEIRQINEQKYNPQILRNKLLSRKL